MSVTVITVAVIVVVVITVNIGSHCGIDIVDAEAACDGLHVLPSISHEGFAPARSLSGESRANGE